MREICQRWIWGQTPPIPPISCSWMLLGGWTQGYFRGRRRKMPGIVLADVTVNSIDGEDTVRIITSVLLGFFVFVAAGCGQSDKAVEAGVKARLAADPIVHSRQIDVDSHQGTVTLSGRIDTREERQHAMQVAASTEGVLRVIDHLEVASAFDQTSPSQTPDRTH